MRYRLEPDEDVPRLRSWIHERARDFPPLVIVDADVDVDGDDDEPLLILTLQLAPPAEAETWPTSAVLQVYRAVREWGRTEGYPSGPHVHLQSTALAEAG